MVISAEAIASALKIMIPSYITNGAAVVFGGGKPLDLGRNFVDGKRLFGDNKTFRGLMGGFAAGALASVAMQLLAGDLAMLGILATIGALAGDLMGAFLKRRLGMPPGAPFPILDQLDFVFGALAFTYPVYRPAFEGVIFLVIVTPPIHLATNAIAYMLNLKKTYW